MFSKPKTFTTPNTNSSTVPAVKYTIKVFEGTMDMIHGGGHDITEIFIPSHKVCFNEEGWFFLSEKQRKGSNATEIQLSQDLVEKVARCANLQAQLNQEKESLKSDPEYKSIYEQTLTQTYRI